MRATHAVGMAKSLSLSIRHKGAEKGEWETVARRATQADKYIYVSNSSASKKGRWETVARRATEVSNWSAEATAEGRKGKAALVSNFCVPPKVAEVRKGRQPLVSNFCELGSSSSLFVSWEIKYI